MAKPKQPTEVAPNMITEVGKDMTAELEKERKTNVASNTSNGKSSIPLRVSQKNLPIFTGINARYTPIPRFHPACKHC